MNGASGLQRVVMAMVLAVGVAACSGGSGGGEPGAGTNAVTTGVNGAPSTGTGSTVSDTHTAGSSADGSGPSTTARRSNSPTTTIASASTTGPGGEAPDDTDPFAIVPEPDPTEPDDMPGPPADDCIDAPAGPAAVELSFDDDRVLYAGAAATSCLRVHAAQQLVLRNAGSVSAVVVIGVDTFPVAAGATVATAPLGVVYDVGDVFDVYVETLDTNVVVQVLP